MHNLMKLDSLSLSVVETTQISDLRLYKWNVYVLTRYDSFFTLYDLTPIVIAKTYWYQVRINENGITILVIQMY